MKRWVCAFLACAALTAPAAAQRPAFTAAMSAWIDRLGQYEVRAGRTPGLAIGVVMDGRIVYARGFGDANLAQHLPVDADTQFYIGGVSQQFTAAAMLMLEQDGKIKLDDKIVKYLPELATVAPEVTIAQLLLQTSGLPDAGSVPGFSADRTREMKIADLLAALDKMKPSAPAGTAYANNDLNYLLAGTIVERAGGVPLSDYLQQHVFLPLVMDRTFLAGDSGISGAHAVGYTLSSASNRFEAARTWDRTWLYGGNGVVSTIYDLAKWDIEMPILLRVDAVRTMFTPNGISKPAQYGMGWVIDRRGGKLFTWYQGQIPGYRAMNALLPDDHIAVIVLANADALHGGRVADPQAIAARILDLVEPPARAHLDNAVLTRAKEWLVRLADRQIDRTQLTAEFSAYLTDSLVARENFAALGKLQAIVPISSATASNGDTVYEFLVRYPHDVQYHYRFGLTKENKIDQIELAA
jgi:D-alanyl-D-alanine carboxypeptidase